MTKLTTERLEKLQDDLLQFQDHYSDPADKENYDIFVDALHMLDEFKAAKEKLMAYEQAAEHPAARITWDGSEFSVSNVSEDFLYGGTAVYLAPVLPKQPELVDLSQQVEILNRILNWMLKELPVPTQKASAMAIRLSSVIDIISGLEVSAPAQPVSEPYKLPDNLDFDCEFENGDYDIDEEPWLRGRVDGFNEALQIIKRSLNAKQNPTVQESE